MAPSMSKATATSHKPLGTFQIYKEAFNLPKKNLKLILYVFLIYIITSTLLVTINQLSVHSLLTDIAKKTIEMQNTEPTDPMFYKLYTALMNELKELAVIEIIFIVVAFIIGVIIMIMAVCAFSLTYVENYVTLKELLCKVKGNLKGPVITQILSILLNFGYLTLVGTLLYLFWFLGNGSLVVMAVISLVSILAVIWYLSLYTWWLLSTIASVIEEGCYGVDAFKRASDLMKGRKWKGVSIFLLYTLIAAVLYAVVRFTAGSSGQGNLWIQLLVSVVMQVFTLFFLAAMTVYYYECKKSLEHEGLLVIGNVVYSSLPTTNVDAHV